MQTQNKPTELREAQLSDKSAPSSVLHKKE